MVEKRGAREVGRLPHTFWPVLHCGTFEFGLTGCQTMTVACNTGHALKAVLE